MRWSESFFGVRCLKQTKKYWHVSIEVAKKYTIGTIINFDRKNGGGGWANKEFECIKLGESAKKEVIELLKEKVKELDILDAGLQYGKREKLY